MGRIVEATYCLIEHTGNPNPSLREVLSETGVPTQAFYGYFQSKDERFPAEHQASLDRLAELLAGPVGPRGGDRAPSSVVADVTAVYDLTFAALRRHLTCGTRPTGAELDHLVGFALAGIGAASRTTRW